MTVRRSAEVARSLDVRFVEGDDDLRVLLEGQDVTSAIRSEEGGRAASMVAADAAVRECADRPAAGVCGSHRGWLPTVGIWVPWFSRPRG